jgi:hypothetical protein
MNSQKYIVFNMDDFNEFDEGHPEEIPDAVTFRLKDRFAAPAIQAYFDAICNVIEVLEEFGMPDDNTMIEDLTVTRDWAFEMVTRAREIKDKKIPDHR